MIGLLCKLKKATVLPHAPPSLATTFKTHKKLPTEQLGKPLSCFLKDSVEIKGQLFANTHCHSLPVVGSKAFRKLRMA